MNIRIGFGAPSYGPHHHHHHHHGPPPPVYGPGYGPAVYGPGYGPSYGYGAAPPHW